ncbi:TadE/TadG family type IV pilus assembly protein [Candidatus Liberibacter sp.]|uniref:TadE/TadG family type IV pilus assembly protein n=1 Tax=Candidatus Liberibacter sp. TaxID=34022 RepID=UPI002870259A|nr:TadE/TadG family type IV pilus assembly protein [Candidatus Liberibacter sp.]
MSSKGVAAIEFALLAFPYFLVVFAIFETSISFVAGQVIENASYDIARKIRTGEFRKDHINIQEFRKEFCKEISIFISCSEKEKLIPDDLYIDVRKIDSLADIPIKIPRVDKNPNSDAEIDAKDFDFNPGGSGTYNVLRVFYHWPILTDIMRKYMSTVKHKDKQADYLIMSTVAFKNEPF